MWQNYNTCFQLANSDDVNTQDAAAGKHIVVLTVTQLIIQSYNCFKFQNFPISSSHLMRWMQHQYRFSVGTFLFSLYIWQILHANIETETEGPQNHRFSPPFLFPQHWWMVPYPYYAWAQSLLAFVFLPPPQNEWHWSQVVLKGKDKLKNDSLDCKIRHMGLSLLPLTSSSGKLVTCKVHSIRPQERGLVHAGLTYHLLQLLGFLYSAAQVLSKTKKMTT